jgi:hypothetical protein
LFEVATKYQDLQNAIKKDPAQSESCAELSEKLNAEVAKHKLQTTAIYKGVNPPNSSAHVFIPTTALDMSVKSLTKKEISAADALAAKFGVKRTCLPKDVVHYGLGPTCAEAMLYEAFSPVALMVVAPDGRRIGWDGTEILNEIGDSAYYSGPAAEPQWLMIGGARQGVYDLRVVGTADGPYTIRASSLAEDGTAFRTAEQSGSVRQGEVFSLKTEIALQTDIDIKPGANDNPIYVAGNGRIPVAVLSSDGLDASSQLDFNSARFGPKGNEARALKCAADEDVNNDGLLDAVCHFSTQESAFGIQDAFGMLTIRRKDGVLLQGADTVQMVK